MRYLRLHDRKIFSGNVVLKWFGIVTEDNVETIIAGSNSSCQNEVAKPGRQSRLRSTCQDNCCAGGN